MPVINRSAIASSRPIYLYSLRLLSLSLYFIFIIPIKQHAAPGGLEYKDFDILLVNVCKCKGAAVRLMNASEYVN